MRVVDVTRETKETQISLRLGLPEEGTRGPQDVTVATGIPFFDHMLHALFFHGGFTVELAARGDIDVDHHHTVEDVGIVIGDALAEAVSRYGPIQRFGHAAIPMDDALGEVIVDACGRSYLVYRVTYPQGWAGNFDLSLVREFFQGFASHGKLNIHVIGHYGENGHHLAEAIFKATGRALGAAYRSRKDVLSTKGVL